MKRPHHKFGCLLCGKKRKVSDGFKYDVYLKCGVNESLTRVGLCKLCFQAGNFDLDQMKTKLVESEEDFAKNQKASADLVKTFKKARFVGHMSHVDFWANVNKKKLANSKLKMKSKDFLEIVKNARK